MKQYLVIALGFLLVPRATLAQPAVLIAEYRFDSIPSTTLGTLKPFLVNPLVLSSASWLGHGSSLNANVTFFNGQTGGALNRARASTNWSSVLDLNKYFGITLTVIPGGYTLVIDEVRFRAGRSPQGPGTIEIRTSNDGYAANAWSGTNPVTPVGMSPVWAMQSRTSGLPSTTSSVGIRLYTYGTTGTGTTWRIDSLRVYGHLLNVFNLPISLLSFNGTARERDVRLDWSTATEQNNDYFTVEKSYDGQMWEEVGRLSGAGTSFYVRSYSMLDPHPMPGWNYYRLRQTDLDGTDVISATTEVLWRARGPTQAYSLDGRLIDDWSDEHLDLPRWQIYILRDAFGRATRYYAP